MFGAGETQARTDSSRGIPLWDGPTRKGIPNLFCWTKMGVEAGQDLQSILRRKELERQAGDGVFVWGIGNSLGPSIREFSRSSRTMPILFSPIQSKPRPVDVSPAALVIWLSYFDEVGELHPLPSHSLVTSRGDDVLAGQQKRHYALLCHSQVDLLEEDSLEVHFDELCNASTSKGLGFSQVTALVRRVPRSGKETTGSGRKYKVPFQAELFAPYCVRLADGVSMPPQLAQEVAKVAHTASPAEWADFVQELKAIARRQMEDSMPLFHQAVSN